MKCALCGRIFSEGGPDVAPPFCSERCKMIDRRRWIDEMYGVPYVSEERADDPWADDVDNDDDDDAIEEDQ